MELNKIIEGYKKNDYSDYIKNLNSKLANNDFKLYKYIPINRFSDNIKNDLIHEKQYGIKSIVGNFIYHNKPSFFNDPYDCVFGMGINALFREGLAEITDIKDISKILDELRKDKDISNFDELFNELEKIPMADNVRKYMTFLFTKIKKTLQVDEFDIEKAMDEFALEILKAPLEFMGFLKPFISDKIDENQLSNQMKELAEKIGVDNLKDISMDPLNPDIKHFKEMSMFAGLLPEAEKVESILDDSVYDFNKRIFNLIDDKFGIASLTTKYDNPLMWSHYASSHEGICIEYDFKDFFQNNNNPSTLLHEVLYSDNRVTLDATILDKIDIKDIENRGKFDVLEFFLEGLFTKHHVWEYEQEWRSILIFKESRELKFNNISAIYLGNKMDADVAEQIMKLFEDRDFSIYKMTNDISEYRMIPVKIK
ncbi:MAG TPA: DUF2971 domain-containing protein [Edaphocola sp.]|jgi:hypothetical protein|nr:DUF2971 domain-containing protein [Acholeplasmataceae bacterium]HTO16725.1 DUF2971 domain-containing protein [Edaphocola sp.]